MKTTVSYLIIAAMILLSGCAPAQNTAAPAGNGSGQAAAQAQAQAGQSGADLSGTETDNSGKEENSDGSAASSFTAESDNAENGTDASSDAVIAQETVTIVIPTVYESVTTQEEAEEIRKANGYESAVLNEDGSLTIVMSRSQHDEMLYQFKKSVDEGIAEIIRAAGDSAIEKIEYNDEYSVFTVTVSGDEIGIAERQAADELVMYGTLYHIYSGNDADHIQVEYVGGSGEVIETADSGSI